LTLQYKKARKANEAGYVLPQDKSQFFATLLEEFVNQMKWPIDMEWDPADPGDEEDEEFDAFIQRRSVRNESRSNTYDLAHVFSFSACDLKLIRSHKSMLSWLEDESWRMWLKSSIKYKLRDRLRSYGNKSSWLCI
jgi:hypothetical protein